MPQGASLSVLDAGERRFIPDFLAWLRGRRTKIRNEAIFVAKQNKMKPVRRFETEPPELVELAGGSACPTLPHHLYSLWHTGVWERGSPKLPMARKQLRNFGVSCVQYFLMLR